MKQLLKYLSLGAFCLFYFTACFAATKPDSSTDLIKKETIMENQEKKAIKKVLMKYLTAADQSNVVQLDQVMHENFRVILNDTNKGEVSVVDKATYLDLIGKKIFGGKPRKVEVESIDVYGETNAQLKVKLTSSELTFYNYFSLLKQNGKWYVVQDFLYVEPIQG